MELPINDGMVYTRITYGAEDYPETIEHHSKSSDSPPPGPLPVLPLAVSSLHGTQRPDIRSFPVIREFREANTTAVRVVKDVVHVLPAGRPMR